MRAAWPPETLGSFHKPNDIVIVDVEKADIERQLTAVNEAVLKDVRLGEVEEIRYRSSDGLKIRGWIFKSPNTASPPRSPIARSRISCPSSA